MRVVTAPTRGSIATSWSAPSSPRPSPRTRAGPRRKRRCLVGRPCNPLGAATRRDTPFLFERGAVDDHDLIRERRHERGDRSRARTPTPRAVGMLGTTPATFGSARSTARSALSFTCAMKSRPASLDVLRVGAVRTTRELDAANENEQKMPCLRATPDSAKASPGVSR